MNPSTLQVWCDEGQHSYDAPAKDVRDGTARCNVPHETLRRSRRSRVGGEEVSGDDFRRTLRPCRWCAIPTDPRELDHRDVCIPCDDEWHQARADEQAELEKLS